MLSRSILVRFGPFFDHLYVILPPFYHIFHYLDRHRIRLHLWRRLNKPLHPQTRLIDPRDNRKLAHVNAKSTGVIHLRNQAQVNQRNTGLVMKICEFWSDFWVRR
jgi:hypothetical protein